MGGFIGPCSSLANPLMHLYPMVSCMDCPMYILFQLFEFIWGQLGWVMHFLEFPYVYTKLKKHWIPLLPSNPLRHGIGPIARIIDSPKVCYHRGYFHPLDTLSFDIHHKVPFLLLLERTIDNFLPPLLQQVYEIHVFRSYHYIRRSIEGEAQGNSRPNW